MRNWVRVEPSPPFTSMAKAFAVFGAAIGVLATAGVLFGDYQGPPSSALWVGALVLLLVGLWTAVAWRMALVGMYLSAGHVHIRSFSSTRTVFWPSVTKMVSRSEEAFQTTDGAPHRTTIRLWLVLDDDEEVETPVQCSATMHPESAAKLLSPVLTAPEYERVKYILHTEWRRAVAAVSRVTED